VNAHSPNLIVVAGPNGAGKTTFALRFLPEIARCRNFVNADLIARGISPLNVDAAAIQAGRLFLSRIREQMDRHVSFGFESTLSGTTYVRWMKAAKERGYVVHLYYLWIPSIQLALRRIEERVKRGGHDIPADVVRRRYGKGLSNLFGLYLGLADYAAIFDNSSVSPVLVFEKSRDVERVVLPDVFSLIRNQSGSSR
jgi:predicted ABC-type ATPase